MAATLPAREEIMDHFRRTSRSLALLTAVMATPVVLSAPARAEDTFKLGIVTFLSGPAADSFGVPARNGGQFVVDELNKVQYRRLTTRSGSAA
jgi:branched-chain amino acid transport system substrate-binding protein